MMIMHGLLTVKHLGKSKQLHTLSKESSSYTLELGDNKSYANRGLGSTSLKPENGAKVKEEEKTI